jgi:hypothetical protein
MQHFSVFEVKITLLCTLHVLQLYSADFFRWYQDLSYNKL